MYLSSTQYDNLRNIVANFEVAYRSLIAKVIIEKHPTTQLFENQIDILKIQLSTSTTALSGKLFSKVSTLKLIVDSCPKKIEA